MRASALRYKSSVPATILGDSGRLEVCAIGWAVRLGLMLGLYVAMISAAAFSPNLDPAGSDRVLVQPRAGLRAAAWSEWHAAHGMRVRRAYPALGGLEVLQVPPGSSAADLAQRYRASGLVRFAEPDHRVYATATPNDPHFLDGLQWGFWNHGQSGGVPAADINAPGGWAWERSASNVIVAVIDSGARLTHEDLVPNLWTNPREMPGNGRDDDGNGYIDDVHGINTVDYTGNPADDYGHGTHAAGIIGAVGNNGKGVTGVAWHIQLLIAKFLDNQGAGYISDAVECVAYSLAQGAQILNLSWTLSENSEALRLALEQARQAGVLVVAASGNQGRNNDLTPVYPGNYTMDNLITVMASTDADAVWLSSNYGVQTVAMAAPGSSIYSTWNTADHAYAYSSGTSMAAPFVSGALALARVRFPQATYRQLLDRLEQTTDPLPSLTSKCRTGGRLNLQRLLRTEAPQPGRLAATGSPPGHPFAFQLLGEPYQTYRVEGSSNLQDWRELLTQRTAEAGILSLTDGGVVLEGHRFYRALALP